MKTSSAFIQQKEKAFKALQLLLGGLEEQAIPFYSPRYSAHMSVDQSLPAILGYLSTMFYNPNNVAFEASPFTTRLEIEVGVQLCDMLGYTVDNSKSDTAWGHITCDGTGKSGIYLVLFSLLSPSAILTIRSFLAFTISTLRACKSSRLHLIGGDAYYVRFSAQSEVLSVISSRCDG